METYLKVKIKSLAEEARIIRHEEKKAKKRGNVKLVNGLTEHRKGIVRQVQRDTLIAYGYIRGKSYKESEPNSKKHVDTNLNPRWPKVREMVKKYGTIDQASKFDGWLVENGLK